MPKIFADQCVHTDLVKALKTEGFELVTAAENSMQEATDPEIFSYAQEKKMVLLTFDRGFGNPTIFEIQDSPGIVIILIEKMSKETIVEKTLQFFESKQVKDLKGKLFIVEPTRVRTNP
mgnify:CR=1 FL=1